MLTRSLVVATLLSCCIGGGHAYSIGRGAIRRPALPLRGHRQCVAVAQSIDNEAFPDERTRRAALEAAFTQIDTDGSSTLDREELSRAGFDADYVLSQLDANCDGALSRDEFVDQLVALYTNEGPCSAWEEDDLVSLQRRVEQLPQQAGSVWGSRTVRRAITEPRFELVSLVAVLTTSLCYAVGTLNGLSSDQRFALSTIESFFTVVFAVEYVLRWWGRSFSKRSLVEPAALIDLVSFAPLLVQLVLTTYK
jgi:hypothetical protein